VHHGTDHHRAEDRDGLGVVLGLNGHGTRSFLRSYWRPAVMREGRFL
jgi:hypothetical protein